MSSPVSLRKCIFTPKDLLAWTNSAAYQDIIQFIEAVSIHLISRPTRSIPISMAAQSLSNLLLHMQQKTEEFPPDNQPQRFGNASFKSWFNWLKENGKDLCQTMLFEKNNYKCPSNFPFDYAETLDEVSGYLIESVGNSTRIDYGTGHELAFIAFLVCLFKANYLSATSIPVDSCNPGEPGEKDYVAVGLVIMPAYLKLVRHLQTYYRMEPAGSHGVWCLDDFQFVPFIWGASQLIGHTVYKPLSIPNRQVAVDLQDNYLFFSCIAYIYQVKTGPFEEHSSTLQGISQVPNWDKVHSGLIKMYKGEVLNKFPVVQHFLFGRLMTLDPASTRLPLAHAFRAPDRVRSKLNNLHESSKSHGGDIP